MSATLQAEILKKYVSDVFIETGTYDGRGVELALLCGFKEVHSIEIDPTRYIPVARKFCGVSGVWIYPGDTVDILPVLVSRMTKRSTLWLDAHPIGSIDTCPRGKAEWPLLEELKLIGRHSIRRDHTLLLDDRSCFSTLFGTSDDELKSAILGINPDYKFSLEPNAMHPEDILVARIPT